MKRPRLPNLAELAWLKDSASYLTEYNAEQERERQEEYLYPFSSGGVKRTGSARGAHGNERRLEW